MTAWRVSLHTLLLKFYMIYLLQDPSVNNKQRCGEFYQFILGKEAEDDTSFHA